MCCNAALLHSWLRVVFLGICLKSVSVSLERSTVCYCIRNTAQHFLLCFYSSYNMLHIFFHSISAALFLYLTVDGVDSQERSGKIKGETCDKASWVISEP